MAWTNPRTYTTGEVLTKAILDVHIRDNLLYLKNLLGGSGDQVVQLDRSATTEENILTLNNAGAGGASAVLGLEMRRTVSNNVALRFRFINVAYNAGWDITMPHNQTYLSFTQIGAAEYLRLTQNSILFASGDASTPGVAFLADPNTGMFSAGADLIGFTLGGTERIRMSTTGIGIQSTTGNGYGWMGVSSNITYGGSESININPGGSTRVQIVNSGSPYGETTSYVSVSGAQLNAIHGSVVPVVVDRQTNDGVLISLRQSTTEEGNISVSGTGVSYNLFKGSHFTQLKDGQEEPPVGGVVVSTGERIESDNVLFVEDVADLEEETNERGETVRDAGGRPRLKVARVREVLHQTKEHASWRERRRPGKNYFVYTAPAKGAGDPAVYGIWAGKINDDAAGSSFGKNGRAVYAVTAVGLWECRVTDTGGDIAPGDLLCTSPRKYEAQKQESDLVGSATLGKAHSGVRWSEVPVDTTLGYKWAMVTIALFAG